MDTLEKFTLFTLTSYEPQTRATKIIFLRKIVDTTKKDRTRNTEIWEVIRQETVVNHERINNLIGMDAGSNGTCKLNNIFV